MPALGDLRVPGGEGTRRYYFAPSCPQKAFLISYSGQGEDTLISKTHIHTQLANTGPISTLPHCKHHPSMKRKKPITECPSLDENRDIKQMHTNPHLQPDVETQKPQAKPRRPAKLEVLLSTEGRVRVPDLWGHPTEEARTLSKKAENHG